MHHEAGVRLGQGVHHRAQGRPSALVGRLLDQRAKCGMPSCSPRKILSPSVRKVLCMLPPDRVAVVVDGEPGHRHGHDPGGRLDPGLREPGLVDPALPHPVVRAHRQRDVGGPRWREGRSRHGVDPTACPVAAAARIGGDSSTSPIRFEGLDHPPASRPGRAGRVRRLALPPVSRAGARMVEHAVLAVEMGPARQPRPRPGSPPERRETIGLAPPAVVVEVPVAPHRVGPDVVDHHGLVRLGRRPLLGYGVVHLAVLRRG